MNALESPRLTMNEAAAIIRTSYESLRRLIDRGVFTVMTSAGNRGKGLKIFLNGEEVRAYADGGLDALRQFRESKGRLPKAKK